MARLVFPALLFASIAACAHRPEEPPRPQEPSQPAARTLDRPRPTADTDPQTDPGLIPPAPIGTRPNERIRRSSGTHGAVCEALDWLAARQSPDGGWDADVGTTGLALLALLGAGETHQSGTYREAGTVRRGVQFLRQWQHADGCVGPRGANDTLRNHAVAAIALTEAYGMTSSKPFEEPARRSVAFALTTRTPGGGWHRPASEGGGLDVATTGWMVMLLKSAGMSELGSHDAEIAEAVAELSRPVDPTTGRVAGATAARDAAIVLTSRIFAGHTPKTHPDLRAMADAILEEPPSLATSRDVARTYFGTMAIYQFGGRRWRRWADPMVEAIRASARFEPDVPGRVSWDAKGPGTVASPVRATALCCMTMSVFYRIGDMEGWRRSGEKWNE